MYLPNIITRRVYGQQWKMYKRQTMENLYYTMVTINKAVLFYDIPQSICLALKKKTGIYQKKQDKKSTLSSTTPKITPFVHAIRGDLTREKPRVRYDCCV